MRHSNAHSCLCHTGIPARVQRAPDSLCPSMPSQEERMREPPLLATLKDLQQAGRALWESRQGRAGQGSEWEGGREVR